MDVAGAERRNVQGPIDDQWPVPKIEGPQRSAGRLQRANCVTVAIKRSRVCIQEMK
jgi:hypothetical protein